MSRRDDDARIVSQYLPKNTTLTVMNGHDVWVFTMQTEVRIAFKIGIYYDPDERGYAALAIAPEIEGRLKDGPHPGHLFSDGSICFGGTRSRVHDTLRETYAKSCFWAEGIALAIAGKTHFPFSKNNRESEADNFRNL